MVKITSPEEFYGHQMGADKKLARWDKIVEYFSKLDGESDRIKVVELGKSTEGNPFTLAYISSVENLSKLDDYRQMSWDIAHPKGLSDERIEEIKANGKTVMAITNSLHATEIGGTQMSSEFAYDLITKDDDLTKKIRENVILLLFPCINPDGNIMVVDWYNKYLGTEYEGGSMPYLYHKYVGHDNNRDALTLTQVETQLVNKVVLQDWYPQAYIDHHHMGSTGARFFIPPNTDPINENTDPMVWVEQRHYGSQMLMRMETNGIYGVESAASYPADFMPGFSLTLPWYGICGMFTESASAKMATPVYVHYHQMGGSSRGRPEYRPSMNMQHPWKGGWWHLRDVLEGQMTASWAMLEVAANNRELVLDNMYKKATKAICQGSSEAPYAFILPPDQHDYQTMLKLLDIIHQMGIEITKATTPVKVGSATYPAGSFVIPVSQTARAFLVCYLKRTFYRDSIHVRKRDDTPIMNYDYATMTMHEFKGVKVIEADVNVEGEFELITKIPWPNGCLTAESEYGYLLDPRVNDSFKAVNALLKNGVEVHRIEEAVGCGSVCLPPGAFYVPNATGVKSTLEDIARATTIDFIGLPEKLEAKTHQVKMPKIALYQRYRGGNMDEGWTRWLLEQYGYDYTTVMDDVIKEGLPGYDMLILPSDSKEIMIGEKLEEFYKKQYKGRRTLPKFPEEYRSGFKEDGVKKIKEFIQNGGTVLTWDASTDFAIEKLDAPVLNSLKDLKPKDFHSPGSTLWSHFDICHPLGYGMPKKGLVPLRGKIAFNVKPGTSYEECQSVANYVDEHLMESGWLIGEKHLARKSSVVDIKKGEGRMVLYGFRPQARGMTDGTFKLFFNAIY